MIESGVLALLLASGAAPPPRGARVEEAQLTIRQRIERVIVRVRTPRDPAPPRQKWKDKKGPRCMATDMIAGAAVTTGDSVDFVMKGGTRLRARLESDCPALDYYGGFYLAPTADRKICADRDSIHARSGGECQITRFRTLVPDR
ncbi:hypothetical protein [Sphingomonas profundi]|uniref:hypothetical protein n=1 Tax=Alterirhizorhabdus profundi TaxID=2681549 RepID=UPI0012E82003|nr:hypothetical protein [Sphingomonas profundi]